jgi:cardiolipin synthase A/B
MAVDEYEDGVAKAGLLFTAPTLGSTPAERYLALSIAGARKRLYITNAYFAPDDNFVAMLAPGGPTWGGRSHPCRWTQHRRRRGTEGGPRTIRETAPGRRAGVRISGDHPARQDVRGRWQWVSIGTMNFDNRSLALNDESTLMVLDSAAGRQMEAVFLDDPGYAGDKSG